MAASIERYSIYHDKELGLYSKFTPVHHIIVELSLPLVLDAIEHIPFSPKNSPAFHIVDYGAGDGGTSSNLLDRVIDKIRDKYGRDQDVLISYEDQKNNDFSSLVKRIYNDHDDENIRKEKAIKTIGNNITPAHLPNTFISMCATDFYRQCFPKASVDLGISFSAMHWMRRKPCILKNNIWYITSDDESEKQAYQEEGRHNLETILLNQAKELRPGGRLVLAFSGVKEGPLTNFPSYDLIFVHIEKIWNEMYSESFIGKDEYENASFHIYIRTEQEVRSPLKDETSALYKSGLRLISVETIVTSSPFTKLLADKDNLEANAVLYVKSVRSWTNSCFYSALSDRRTEQEKQTIVEELFKRYTEDVIRNPSHHDTLFSSIYVYIRKI